MARVATSSRGTRPDGTPRGRDLGVVASAASSDRGWCRLEQEDRCLITPPLFAIADGVGGGQAGEVAAQIALGALGRGDTVAIDPAALLRAGCATADADIRRVAGALPAYAGMSTTLTAALVGPAGVTLCNIGDTRAYVFRAGVLHQLTRDHSFVAELVRRGALSAEKAEAHPLRSLITRCLGGAIDERPDLYSVRPHPGDVYLLCSDGLSGQVAHSR
jgi:serine/threonine protein phosphatase PrpC